MHNNRKFEIIQQTKNMKHMALRKIAFFTLSLLFLASCKTNETSDADISGQVSSFISNNKNTVAFGSAHLKDILTKSDYSSNDKLALLFGTEIGKVERVLDIDSKVFFAAEGPISDDGAPAVTHMFMRIKNLDSLKMELESRSFDINKAGKIEYADEGDFVIGMKDNLAIITIRGGDYDAAAVVKENFKLADGKVAGGKVDEILGAEGDLVFAMHLSNLYNTSNTDLDKLNKNTQKEIEEMMNESYVETVFKFEDGAAIMETKNHFSDKLKARMFLNSDKQAPVLKQLGSGTPRAGISVNVDMKKANDFMDEFSPDVAKDLAASMGGPAQLALMSAGNEGIAGLFPGQFGALLFAEQDEFGTTPNFSFFLALTQRGKDLGKMGEEGLSFFVKNIILDDKGLSGQTNDANAPGGKLNLPAGCENFGQSGISVFVNFDGLDMDEFDLDGEENLLRVVKYATFDAGNDGAKLYIKAKKGQENILKQAMDVMMEELVAEIGNIAI